MSVNFADIEIKVAEILVKGAGTASSNDGYVYPFHGLIDFLYNIFETTTRYLINLKRRFGTV